jgi:hypothetical protein
VKRHRVGLNVLMPLAGGGATSRPAHPSRDDPRAYTAQRATSKIEIDGALDDLAWTDAAWTEDFIDIEGTRKPAPPLRTRAKLAWDDANLYVAAEMADPRVWATMTQRDEPLYREQAFELFLDPDGDARNYLELEVNPLNTVYDLVMDKPYRDKGTADASVNLPGLRTAVRVDAGKGWAVEIAIPWAALKCVGREGAAPKPAERWRVNLARMRKDAPDVKDPLPRGLWVWSSQGEVNMHLPERWGSITFAARRIASSPGTRYSGRGLR